MTAEVDLFEASMERFIRLDKADFIGREASLKRKQAGQRMSLVYLEVDATDSDCVGNEPVYVGETVVGVTTSGGYGHAVEKSLAFAYVPPDMTAPGTEFDILIFTERRKARVLADAAWDPANERLRG
jgi:dimethylglycine dehydrogenase